MFLAALLAARWGYLSLQLNGSRSIQAVLVKVIMRIKTQWSMRCIYHINYWLVLRFKRGGGAGLS